MAAITKTEVSFSFPKLPFMALLLAIKALAEVRRPPPIEQEADFRVWCAKTLDLSTPLADLTPIELDDNAIIWLQELIADDTQWEAVYAVFLFLAGLREDDPSDQIQIALADIAAPTPTFPSPAVILAIIQAIAAMFQWFKQR